MITALRDRHDVIIKVLESAHLAHLWSLDGPTAEARRIRDEQTSESVLVQTWVRLAFALFDGSGGLEVAELFDKLPMKDLTIALSLLFRISLGEDSIEALASFTLSDEEPELH